MASIEVNMEEDPVVIVGMACRLPGQASSPEKFWELIESGRSAHSKIPSGRFNVDAYYHPDPERQGAIYTKNAYFIDQDPGNFDAPFFSMTATEAAGMDPIQRLLLEVAYESLENAGIPISKLSGSNTACYVGCFTKDYEEVSGRDMHSLNPYAATGLGRSMLSNRISWFFDLLGPSITLDTACSASLYGVHLACQSLLTNESEMAIVAGANIMLSPDLFRSLCAMQFMSKDGRCYSFDSRANGYARGEGFCCMVMKRLSKAIADGDTIRAVLRATGINQDGKTPGITVPSSSAQARLIKHCYEKSGLSYDDTAYFEAHGTGTLLGDPLELAALGSTFGTTRDPTRPLYVSSAKTNIGHQEGGAGLAGLTRAVLALEKGLIPPLADHQKPNPKLKLDEWKVKLATECVAWPRAGLRRASVNSFGYGGANAHAIVDDAYHYLKARGLTGKHRTQISDDSSEGSDSGLSVSSSYDDLADAAGHKFQIFSYSAFDQQALGRMYPEHAKYLESYVQAAESKKATSFHDLDTLLRNLAFTLAERRTLFERRAFAVADSADSLKTILLQAAPISRKTNKHDKLVFVFTGQGAQYAQQGKELLLYPVVSQSVQRAQETLDKLGATWDAVAELNKPSDESKIDLPEFSQPLCTILQLAQVDLLASWNISPKAVVGHSSGEIAAAYAHGAISHEDAVKIAYNRGIFSGDVNNRQTVKGGMMAVGLSSEQVTAYLENVPAGTVVVACINSPSSVTLSGNLEQLRILEEHFKVDSVFARMLKVKTGYHSHLMKVVADDYLKSLGGIEVNTSKSDVLMFSSVTGEMVKPGELGAEYWVANMLQPVQFAGALSRLVQHKDTSSRRAKPFQFKAVIEVGPHGALQGPIKQTLVSLETKSLTDLEYTSASSRGKNAIAAILSAVGFLWSLGQPVDLTRINNLDRSTDRLISLADVPHYPWSHQKILWHEAHASKARRAGAQPRTDLLGIPEIYQHAHEPRWRNIIRTNESPWMLDHKVQDALVLPGAAMLVAALEAARKMAEPGRVVKGYEFRDIVFMRGLMLPAEHGKLDTALHVTPRQIGTKADTAPWYAFKFSSFPEEAAWQDHARGLFKVVYETATNEVDAGKEAKLDWESKMAQHADLQSRISTIVSGKAFYKYAETQGYQYGPTFQGVEEVGVETDGSWYGSTLITDTKRIMPKEFEYEHLLHPTTLDCMFQLPLGPRSQLPGADESWVPVGVDKMWVAAELPQGPGARFRGFGHGKQIGDREAKSTIVMSDDSLSEPKVIIDGLLAMSLSAMTGSVAQASTKPSKCLSLSWHPWTRNVMPDLDLLDDVHELSPELTEKLSVLISCVQRTVKAFENVDAAHIPKHVQSSLEWAKNIAIPKYSTMTIGPHAITPAATISPELEAFELFPAKLTQAILSGSKIEEVLNEDILNVVNELSTAWLAATNARLEAWFEAVYIDNPFTSVLFVGDGTDSSALYLAEKFADRLKNATLAEADAKSLARSEASLKRTEKTIALKEINILTEEKTELDEEDTYNIILTTSTKIANALHPRLRTEGQLIITGLNVDSDPGTFFHGLNETWSELKKDESILDSAIFDQITTTKGPESTMMTAYQAHNEETMPPNLELHFLVPETLTSELQSFVDVMKHKIEAAGHVVKFMTMADADDVPGRTLISFLDLDVKPFLINLNPDNFEAFKKTVCFINRIFWITRGAQPSGDIVPLQGMATGLLRTLGTENAAATPVHFDLSKEADLGSSAIQDLVFNMIQRTILAKAITKEREYAEKNGRIMVARLFFDQSMDKEVQMSSTKRIPRMEPLVQDKPLRIEIGTRGMLDSLRWVEDDEASKPLDPQEVEFRSTAMSLNFVDIMAALGQIPTDFIGCEAAGVITRVGSKVTRFKPGQSVVGVCREGFHTTYRNAHDVVQEIPAGMTETEAASLPTVYMTAYCGLIDVARLKRSDAILIHAAAGGLGQAAIQIAKWIGCEIFVTVGTIAKRKLLMDQYGIPEDHIFSSRDSTFAQGVMRMTKGKGVQVILNSLAGEQLRHTWSCIADFGRFIEVGKKDIVGNSGLEMAAFMRHITFASVNLEHMERTNHPAFAKLMQDTFDLIRTGAVKAVGPIMEYNFTDLEKACRTMQAGKHTGKIVIKVEANDMVPVVPPEPARVQLDPNGTYVLCGGLGGIGRSIAKLLFEFGAGHVVFVSRSGASKPQAQEFLQKMTLSGRRVDAFACDTSDPAAVGAWAQECYAKGWKIKGFMQCAMALQNRSIAKLSWDDWDITIKSKVPSTINFHNALPKDMDHFIMLASTSGILGAPGQGNYAAGNTFQDAFAYHRRSLGMSGISIDFGVVSDIGYVAENGGVASFDHFTGFEELHITEKDIYLIIAAALRGKTADERAFPTQPIIGIGNELLSNSILGAPFVNVPRFAHIRLMKTASDSLLGSSDALQAALKEAESVRDAATHVLEAIKSKMAMALMIDAEDVDPSRPLHAFGVDSLVAVEIRNWIFRDLKCEVALFDLLAPAPLTTLALKVASKSKLLSAKAIETDMDSVNKELDQQTLST